MLHYYYFIIYTSSGFITNRWYVIIIQETSHVITIIEKSEVAAIAVARWANMSHKLPVFTWKVSPQTNL